MLSGIYIIWCSADQKFYIGSSVDTKHRLSQHKYLLKKGMHHNKHLQNAWNLYGSDAFVFYVAEYVSKNQLIESEQKWIDRFWDTGRLFNKGRIAERPNIGRHLSKERIQALIESKKGRPATWIKSGWHHSEETKQKMSEARKGKPRSILQIQHTNEIQFSRVGMCASEETKQKLSEIRKGKPWSEARRKAGMPIIWSESRRKAQETRI